MPFAPTAAWVRAMQGDADLSVIVTVQWGSGASDTVTWCRNPRGGPLFGYPDIIKHISPQSSVRDPQRGIPSFGRIDLELALDDDVRDTVEAKMLLNKRIEFSIGTPDLAEADYLALPPLTILQPKPYPWGMKLECGEPWWLIHDAATTIRWTNKHPLYAIHEALLECVPASLIDATSFDPSQAQYADISHWVVARWRDQWGVQAALEPTQLIEEIANLSELLGGGVIIDEQGRFSFRRADSTAAVQLTLTQGQFTTPEQDGTYADIVNESVVHSHWRGEAYNGERFPLRAGDSATLLDMAIQRLNGDLRRDVMRLEEFRVRTKTKDSTSQSLTAYHDGAGGSVSQPAKRDLFTRWLNGMAWLEAALGDGSGAGQGIAGETFVLYGAGCASICGTGSFSRGGGPNIPTWAQIDPANSRRGLIRIDDEVIEIDDVAVDDDNATVRHTGNTAFVGYPAAGTWLPARMTCRILTRGAKGTTARAHLAYDDTAIFVPVVADGELQPIKPPGIALDVTAQYAINDRDIDRWANGAPVLHTETGLDKLSALPGENIALDHTDLPCFYGYNGVVAADNLKWEVLSIEIDWTGRPPKLIWSLMLLDIGNAGTKTNETIDVAGPDLMQRGAIEEMRRSTWRKHIEDGLVLGTGSSGGLNGAVTAGHVGGSNGGLIPRQAADNIPLDASEDHYVWVERATGELIVSRYALGSADPGLRAGWSRLGKYVTGAAAITTTTDQRALTRQSFRAYAAAGKGLGVAAAWIVVDANTEVFDHGGSGVYGFVASVAPVVAQFVAPYAGKFELGGAVQIEGSVTAVAVYRLGLSVNGAAPIVILDRHQTAAALEEIGLSGWAVLDLARGDTVELVVQSSDLVAVATYIGGSDDTWFAGRRTY